MTNQHREAASPCQPTTRALTSRHGHQDRPARSRASRRSRPTEPAPLFPAATRTSYEQQPFKDYHELSVRSVHDPTLVSVVRAVPLDPLTPGATQAPFLTPCHITECQPLEVGAGLPHGDWLGRRRLRGWEIWVKLPCGRFQHHIYIYIHTHTRIRCSDVIPH
jgi:hypothetical protein